jgi:hypothetical protein
MHKPPDVDYDFGLACGIANELGLHIPTMTRQELKNLIKDHPDIRERLKRERKENRPQKLAVWQHLKDHVKELTEPKESIKIRTLLGRSMIEEEMEYFNNILDKLESVVDYSEDEAITSEITADLPEIDN